MAAVDYSKLAPVDELVGEDDEETEQWKLLLRKAESFVGSFSWCAGIRKRHLGIGVADTTVLFDCVLADAAMAAVVVVR
jgi:hypothetical protein